MRRILGIILFLLRLIITIAVALIMTIVVEWDFVIATGIFGANRSGPTSVLPPEWGIAAFLPVIVAGWPTRRILSRVYGPVGVLAQMIFTVMAHFSAGATFSGMLRQQLLLGLVVLGVSFAAGDILRRVSSSESPRLSIRSLALSTGLSWLVGAIVFGRSIESCVIIFLSVVVIAAVAVHRIRIAVSLERWSISWISYGLLAGLALATF